MAFLLRDVEKIVCAVIFLGMTLLGFANVVVRYLTSYSLASTEELLTNGFLLLTIFGAAIAARKGDHLAVTLVYELASRRIRMAILILSGILAVALLVLSAWFSWDLLMNQRSTGIRSYALQIPAWYYSAGMPIGFAIVTIRYIQHALDTWRDLAQGEEASA